MVRELQATDVSVNTLTCEVEGVAPVAEEVLDDSPTDPENVVSIDSLHQDGLEGDVLALVNEQRADPTLEPCWAQAVADKGGFTIHRGLLYHKDQVEGQPVSQLCVCLLYTSDAADE